ncbi:MAG: FKBP-type peptidyl-prolyl cis-trans isomerase, partial [Specibacter sp.]
MRRLLALLLPLLLLVTACSSGSSDPAASDAPGSSVSVPPANAEALASVKVDDQGKGKAPKVTFDKPLA